MKNKHWKTIAIILGVILCFVALWIIVGSHIYKQDQARAESCWSEICKDYPVWDYREGVCYCLNWDTELKDFVIVYNETLN